MSAFRHFDEARAEHWEPIRDKFEAFERTIVARLVADLRQLAGHDLGYPVDRYVHSLQTATRALRDGADDETVVCALLHDIGDTLAPNSHAPLAAAIVAPYVAPLNTWMVAHHEEFQARYYGEYFGIDPESRDRHRDHPGYARTARFTDEWDQKAFDPDYDTLPVEAFLPALDRIFSRPAWGPHSRDEHA